MNISHLTKALIESLNRPYNIRSTGGDVITISRTVSALAVLYEKVRTAIEYREDHLLRRAAIERIIKRRLILNENGRGIAEYLVREVLWAKYIPENSVPSSKIEDIQQTIDKYLFIRNELSSGRDGKERTQLAEWLISSAAAEIEEKLSPNSKREAFINFIYQYYQKKVFLLDETDAVRDIQVYIAVHRAFAKSNDDYIRYSILKLSYPDLIGKTWKDFRGNSKEIYTLLNDIQTHLNHAIGLKLSRSLKKEIAPFLILRDVYEENSKEFEATLESEKKLEEKIERICRKRYDEIKQRLARAGTRSVIYIFITKMVFALGIEYPFEHFYLGELNLMALGINTLFPPVLMLFALLGNKAPGNDNTNRIINRIKDIVYKDEDRDYRITLTLKVSKKRPLLRFIFSLVYLTTFFMVFGVIIYVLSLIKFSVVSQMIFIFFVSVIMFFAYRVRQTGKEYVLSEKDSLFSPAMNFVLLPILSLGKWLSNEVSKLNFFVALFDYLIEAPFKTIFEVFEEWFSFMRKQKDEIL